MSKVHSPSRKRDLCVPCPFNIQDERNPKLRNKKTKYVSPLASLPLSTFGSTVKEAAEILAGTSRSSHTAVGGATATPTAADEAVLGRSAAHASRSPTPSGAVATAAHHKPALGSEVTDTYLSTHPKTAAGVDEALAAAVRYREILRDDAARVAAKRDAAFYDEHDTTRRLRFAEFVYQFRSSRGEHRSAALASVDDGRPLSSFGRNYALPSNTARRSEVTPGPLDYAPPVELEPETLPASTLKGSARADVISTRTGLVGLAQSRSPTPWQTLLQPTNRRSTSSLGELRPRSTQCDSILATRPTSQAQRSRTSTPGVADHDDGEAANTQHPPVSRRPPRPSDTAQQLLRFSDFDGAQPVALQAVDDDALGGLLPLPSQRQAPADGDGGTRLRPRSRTVTPPQPLASPLPTRQLCRCELQDAAALGTGRSSRSSRGAGGSTSQPLSKTRATSTDTNAREGSGVGETASLVRAKTPALEVFLEDLHFSGIGGTWPGTTFMSSHTANVKYKQQEERRRKILRVADSKGSDDVPPEWLSHR